FVLKAHDRGINTLTGINGHGCRSGVATDSEVVDGLYARCTPVIADLVHGDLWEDVVINIANIWVFCQHLRAGVIWDIAHISTHIAHLVPAVDLPGDLATSCLIRRLAV